ncbi:hypothetical protein O6H91_Y317800 [Diphasiastrum complanatum]|nr:hypothetical protein O6H91_Y317800 [Diphasiastrum complanatum]
MAAAMPTPSPNSSPCPSSCSSQIPASLRSSSSARIHQGLQAAGLGLGLGLGLVLVPRLVRHKAALAVSFWATLSMQNENFGSCQSPMFNSLSLGFAEKGVVDQRTGVEFPPTLSHGKAQLAGIGLRKKNILGLKRIVVYAFGVYADADALNEKLGEKYAKVVPEKLKEDKAFYEDIKLHTMEMLDDETMTNRLARIKEIHDVLFAVQEIIKNVVSLFNDLLSFCQNLEHLWLGIHTCF